MSEYFEFEREQTASFLEITLENTTVITRYGKKGTKGRSTEKRYDDPATAVKEYKKLVKEKKEKGPDDSYFTLDGSYEL